MTLFHTRDLQIHDADETNFGIDEAGAFSPRSVRCVTDPVVSALQLVEENPAIRQRMAYQLAPILGLKNASKLVFAIALRGTGTAAGNAVVALGEANLAEGQILKNGFGGESLGTGTTVNDEAASVTGCTLTDASGLSKGQAVLVTLTTGLEATVLKSVTGNDVTFTRALSAAPADGAVVYASATYYPTESNAESLQYQCIGSEDGYYRMLGCQGQLKFSNLNAGQHPQIDVETFCASWAKKAGASLTGATYSNVVNAPIPGFASTLMITDQGTTTRTVRNCNDITIDPGIAVSPWPGISGAVEGMQAWGKSAIIPTIQLTTNPHSMDWHDDMVGSTDLMIHYQIGATAGQTILIELQSVDLNIIPERADINSQLGVQFAGRAREDVTLGTTDLQRAAIRVHLL